MESSDDWTIDIKLTPYLSKMITVGESINAKNKTCLKIKQLFINVWLCGLEDL